MRVIVCGGRDFTDRDLVFKELDRVDRQLCIELVIEGGQRSYDKKKIIGGADYWAMRWAQEREVPYDTMEADWDRYGRRAGPIRNREMLEVWQPLLVVAFPGGAGTRDMVTRARESGVRVYQVKT